MGGPAYLPGLAGGQQARRHLLDDRLRGDVVRAKQLLGLMDGTYGASAPSTTPTPSPHGLRRTLDALRAVLERSRGDLTTSVLQLRLQRAIPELTVPERSAARHPSRFAGILGSAGPRSSDPGAEPRTESKSCCTAGWPTSKRWVRVGDHVRPSTRTADVHRFLTDLRVAGFDGVPPSGGVSSPTEGTPIRFVEAAWPPRLLVGEPDALVSVARLMARFRRHRRISTCRASRWSSGWSTAGRRAAGRRDAGRVVVCHNDVCPENSGVPGTARAVALLGFDRGARSPRLTTCRSSCGCAFPVADDRYAESLGFAPVTGPWRCGRCAIPTTTPAFRLGQEGGGRCWTSSTRSIARSGEWVRPRPGQRTSRMWASVGGRRPYVAAAAGGRGAPPVRCGPHLKWRPSCGRASAGPLCCRLLRGGSSALAAPRSHQREVVGSTPITSPQKGPRSRSGAFLVLGSWFQRFPGFS